MLQEIAASSEETVAMSVLVCGVEAELAAAKEAHKGELDLSEIDRRLRAARLRLMLAQAREMRAAQLQTALRKRFHLVDRMIAVTAAVEMATDEVSRLKADGDHTSDSIDLTALGVAQERLCYHDAVKSGLMDE